MNYYVYLKTVINELPMVKFKTPGHVVNVSRFEFMQENYKMLNSEKEFEDLILLCRILNGVKDTTLKKLKEIEVSCDKIERLYKLHLEQVKLERLNEDF